jgi:hypothetical protein
VSIQEPADLAGHRLDDDDVPEVAADTHGSAVRRDRVVPGGLPDAV